MDRSDTQGAPAAPVVAPLRSDGTHARVLFLTARDAVTDRVVGITAGGDDHVTGQFGLVEVVARLRDLLRAAP